MSFQVSLLFSASDKGAKAAITGLGRAATESGKAVAALGTKGASLGSTLTPNFSKVSTAAQTAVASIRPMDTVLAGVAQEVRQTVQETQRYQAQLDQLRARFNPLFAASQRYEQELRDIAAAEDMLAISAREAAQARDRAAAALAPAQVGMVQLGGATQASAMHVGNMTAQFNDLVVGMQMGQSPMQLAIQQGLQITQVFGQTGSAGAMTVLKQAFTQLISPMNLVTIGAIAATAAVVGWMSSGTAEAASFEDRIEALSAAVAEYSRTVDLATSDTETLGDRFGSVGEQARAAAEGVSAFARADAVDALTASVAALAEEFGPLSGRDRGGKGRSYFNATVRRMADEFEITRGQANALAYSLRRFGNANELDDQVASAGKLNRVLIEVFGTAEKTPQELRRIAQEAAALAESAAEIVGADEAALRAQIAAWKEKIALGAEWLATRAQDYASAQEMLVALQEQNAIRAAEVAFGEDSAEAAELRAAAERRAFEEQLATLKVSEAMKEALRASFEHAQDLSKVDIAGPISAGALAAEWLANRLGVSLELAQGFNRALNASAGLPNASKGGLSFGGSSIGDVGFGSDKLGFGDLNNLPRRNVLDLTAPKAKGAGAKAANSQADALEKLIDKQREELALLQITDPVQKELFKNREALAGATDAERETVEALIRARLDEEEALADLQAQREFYTDTAYNEMRGLILQNKSLEESIYDVADAFAEAALQAALLGEGPLAALFGTDSSGGLFGLIGLGGSGSSGGGLLSDMIGSIFGGSDTTSRSASSATSSPARQVSGSGSATSSPVTINVRSTTTTPLDARVEETSSSGPGRSFDIVLSEQVAGALARPGGAASKVMTSRYGVSKRAPRR